MKALCAPREMENYHTEQIVGRGAHGTVYLCSHKSSDKPSSSAKVIIKQIPIEQMTTVDRQVPI